MPDPSLSIEWWDIDRPIPYKRNARKWDAMAIQKVANSIKEFGFVQPLVCDKDDVIVIGHRRLAAARYLAMEKVPVHIAANLSAEQVRALRIADNKTHEDGATWDHMALGAEFMDLKIAGFDLNLTGFSNDEIAESVFGSFGGKPSSKKKQETEEPNFEPVSEDEQGRLDRKKCKCPKCGHEFTT